MYALELTVYEPERLRYMTKWVYPDVAVRFGSNWLAVERSIRHVIVYSWENYPETLKRISDIEILKQPSTSDFMNILTYYLMQKKAA